MPTARTLTDLLYTDAEGRPLLPPSVHPIPELLQLEVEAVLERFKRSQVADFQAVIGTLDDPDTELARLLASLKAVAEAQPGNPFVRNRVFSSERLEALFLELHEHVMGHPVWRHPCFARIFRGEFSTAQLTEFALHYFNQVKNTRQCVALALGRYSGVMALPYGRLNERISELSQIVLAQLLADEYGVGSHTVEAYPSLGNLFSSTTHIVMYRQIFEGLGVPFEAQDVPLLPGVADNVLTQRLVAGDPAFTNLEALASVGLGMEWGVPEFFSLLLGGMIRHAWQEQLPLDAHHLLVFIAHVQYDVLHAIAVMMVTSLHIQAEGDIEAIKQATNTLMAARYGMMSEIYAHLFGERLPHIAQSGLDERYFLTDRRIEQCLLHARSSVAKGSVVNSEHYRHSTETPYPFK